MACKFYVDGKSVSEREFKKRIIDELKENKIDLSQVFTEPIKTEKSDKENIEGVQGSVGIGKEPLQTEPIQEGSEPKVEADRVLQKPQEGVGQRHEDIEQLREDLGLEPMPEKVVKARKELEAQSEQKIREGYNVGNLIEGVLNGDHTALTDVERTILAKSLKVANDELNAIEDVNSKEFDDKLNEIDRITKALYASGTEAGRALQSIQNRPKLEDESLANMMLMEKDANLGADLTESQKSKVLQEYEEIKKARDEYKAHVEKLQADLDKKLAEEEVQKAKVEVRKAKRKSTHESYIKERDAIKSQMRDKLKNLRKEGMVYGMVIPLPYARELAAIAPEIGKMVKSYVEEGVVTLADVIKNIHEDLKEDLPNLTEDDIRAVLAGRYNERKSTKNEISATVYTLKQEAKKIDELIKLKQGIEPSSETKKREQNKRIAELTKEIKEHDLSKLAAKKKSIKSEISKLEDKIAKGEYAPEVRKNDVVLDSDGRKLQTKLIRLRQERAKRLMQEQYNNRSKRQKAIDAALEIANVPRTILASGDISAPFRQALVATIAHPNIAFRKGGAFREQFKQGWSQDRFDKWFHDIRETDLYPMAEMSGLYIADPHDPRLSAKEEQFMNNLAEKIPFIGKTLIKGSERAYVGYLNKLRWDLFGELSRQFLEEGKTPENSPKLYKDLASFINNSTGRGKAGMLEKAMPVLNAIGFSPRLMASRLNLLNPYYYYKLSPEVRKLALKDMSKFVAVGLVVMALAKLNGNDVEVDPRSTDFGKIISGHTRYDIWGGFQQYARVLAQLITGQKKNITNGDIQELNGEGKFGISRGDVVSRFVRGKLAPIPSTVVDFLTGRTVTGEKVTLTSELTNKMIPLLWQDVYDASKDKGVSAILSVGLPASLGIGTQTYLPKDKYKEHQEKRKEEEKIPTPEDKAKTEKQQLINRVGKLQSEAEELKKHLDEYSDYIGIKLPKAEHISKVDIKGKTKDQVYNLKNTILKSYQAQLEIDKAKLQSMK